jgi:methyl coenzyme M reductase gamma subunit
LSHTRNYNTNNKTLKSCDLDELVDDSIAELLATDKESKLMFKKVINENISSIDVHENETIHAVELEDDENDLFVSDLNQAAYDEEQIESEYVILDVDSVIDEMNDLAAADSFEEEAVDEEFVKKQMIYD